MSTIVTRAGKGSALTWTEGDSNFTNLNTDKLQNIVEDTTPQLGGDLDVLTRIITTSTTNGSIELAPNGTGDVLLTADTVRVGDSNANATITTNGTGNLVLNTNGGTNTGSIQINQGAAGNIILTPDTTGDIFLSSDTIYVGDSGVTANIFSSGVADLVLATNSGSNTGAITISGSNSPITIEPHGTGDVNLNADTVRIGDSAAAATLTTNGAGNLTINTNGGTTTGSIVIATGANGNMTLACNGTGVVSVTSPIVAVVATATVNTPAIFARHTVTASASDTYPSINIQKHRSDIAFTSMTDEPAVAQFQVRDSTSTNRTFFRMIGRYAGTATNPSFTLRGSPNGFTTDLHYMTIGGGVATFGNASSNYTFTSNTGGNLILTANANTTSGTITVASGTNADISITPNGTGRVAISNPLKLASYTAAALTALTGAVGDIAAVTNSAGGGNPNGMIAFWDTTNARWSYVHDNSAV